MIPLLATSQPDLAKGRYAAPPWVIVLVGALVLGVAIALFVVRARSGRKGDR